MLFVINRIRTTHFRFEAHFGQGAHIQELQRASWWVSQQILFPPIWDSSGLEQQGSSRDSVLQLNCQLVCIYFYPYWQLNVSLELTVFLRKSQSTIGEGRQTTTLINYALVQWSLMHEFPENPSLEMDFIPLWIKTTWSFASHSSCPPSCGRCNLQSNFPIRSESAVYYLGSSPGIGNQ